MGIVETIALTLGIGWASGINLYAAIATLGLLGASDAMMLPPGLELLSHPAVIGAAILMYCVEFFADKVPGVDTGWDAIHTFIRIPAGAVLAAAAMADVAPGAEFAAIIVGGGLGGTMAAASHATKSGGRMLINTSPEPFSNWAASIAEDIAVIGGLWLALANPVLFLVLLALVVVAMVWLLPKIWRGVRLLYARIRRWLGGAPIAAGPPPAAAGPDGPAAFRLRLGRGNADPPA